MITFFNLRLKETNDLMRQELKATATPFFKQKGFLGNLPSFRRQVTNTITAVYKGGLENPKKISETH